MCFAAGVRCGWRLRGVVSAGWGEVLHGLHDRAICVVVQSRMQVLQGTVCWRRTLAGRVPHVAGAVHMYVAWVAGDALLLVLAWHVVCARMRHVWLSAPVRRGHAGPCPGSRAARRAHTSLLPAGTWRPPRVLHVPDGCTCKMLAATCMF